jgi:hypothetical protein
MIPIIKGNVANRAERRKSGIIVFQIGIGGYGVKKVFIAVVTR